MLRNWFIQYIILCIKHTKIIMLVLVSCFLKQSQDASDLHFCFYTVTLKYNNKTPLDIDKQNSSTRHSVYSSKAVWDLVPHLLYDNIFLFINWNCDIILWDKYWHLSKSCNMNNIWLTCITWSAVLVKKVKQIWVLYLILLHFFPINFRQQMIEIYIFNLSIALLHVISWKI